MSYRKMNKELKAKWIAALRDPARKQTQGRLRDNKGAMCCIGVLCDVDESGKWDDNNNWINALGKCVLSLNWDMLTKINMTSATHDTLTKMNDARGKTFPEIADWVEKNL